MNVREVLDFAKKNKVQVVDMKFVDLIGTWQHFSCPIAELTEDIFSEGLGFDGSSIRGWAAIHESDMLLVPDPSWYMLDPFTDVPTLVMIGDIVDRTIEPCKKALADASKAAAIAQAEGFEVQVRIQLLDDAHNLRRQVGLYPPDSDVPKRSRRAPSRPPGCTRRRSRTARSGSSPRSPGRGRPGSCW